MATVTITAGVDKLQTAFSTAVAGDTITCGAGTYTFLDATSTRAMIFDSGAVGHSLSGITIKATTPGTVIFDFSGLSDVAFYGGDATGVTIKDITFKGMPTNGYFRDLANSNYTGWVFQNIVLDDINNSGTNKAPFKLSHATIGTGIIIRDITTTANYKCDYVVLFYGTTTELFLTVINVDARVHDGGLLACVWLEDVRRARVIDCKVNGPTTNGFKAFSNDAAKGAYYIDFINCAVDGKSLLTGALLTSGPGLYAGNSDPDAAHATRYVNFINCSAYNIASYGMEIENDTRYCNFYNCSTYNTTQIGIAFAEETQYNGIYNCTIDTVIGATAEGIALVHNRGTVAIHNTIKNVHYGIRHNETGVFTIENEINTIANNVFSNVPIIYQVTTASMPPLAADTTFAGAYLHNNFGPDVVYGSTTTYAEVDGVNKTQAQFEALFPPSIASSGVQTSTLTPYSDQGALNNLSGTNAFSIQEAANVLAGVSAAGDRHTYSTQEALNIAVALRA